MRVSIATLLALATLTPAAQAGSPLPGRIEIHAVKSRTLTGEEFLRADAPGREVVLGGELRLPVGAPQKVPVVILVHGSGGISAGPDAWARTLNEAGVGAFILDTFTGRGIVSTIENQEQLNSLAMMVDAYRTLDVLAAHPRVRADRIAIMGFSKGAVAAVYSATERFRTTYGGTNRFAAHIGFYTPCNVTYRDDTKVGPAPIRLFHGISDDYVSVVPCRDYVARLKAAGADIALTEYPDAQHSFDTPTSPPLVEIPKAQSTRNCRLTEGADGTIANAVTGKPYKLDADACVATGAHVGHNPTATAAARNAVVEFVRTVLQP
ncbi:dienelactone hydrolase family protein [Methylobacterium sp. J-070]|uniref:dienelactone hydrolase family protein n=1 Tax=Methylobacterium sp. J-070 TaxID=2836650 RepID=UPI001FBA949D|nr:dienelactone hydrolase family protein [Methylobacterium sp. J-070]MCJ2053789.1 dienelactone hydrolase family protein [Methylobacterium sp. J-070]